MDQPETATSELPEDAGPEAVRAEANRVLDRVAQRLGLAPQKLRQLIEEGRVGEFLGWRSPGEPDPSYSPPEYDLSGPAGFTGPEPWHEPVEAGMLLRRVCHAIAFHINMDPLLVLTVALWAMHTHRADELTKTPRLVIHSGRVASGKTTLLFILSCLVHRPLTICAAQPGSLLAAISQRPTLLIDDAAALLQSSREARVLIRNGCCRSAGRLLCLAPGSRGRPSAAKAPRPQAVELFTPIAVALDGDVPPVFAGRAIGIPLEPLPFNRAPRPLTPEAIDNFSEMGRMIARWAKDEDDAPADGDEIPGCRDPNWRPLLAIAAAIGDEWTVRTTEAMKRVRTVSGTSELERLLSDIRTIIRDFRAGRCRLTGPDRKNIGDYDRIRSIDLIQQLCTTESARWSEHGPTGQPITPHALARILAAADIRPGMLRFHTGDENGQGLAFNDRGYLFTQFNQAFERYLPSGALDMSSMAHLAGNAGEGER